MNLYDVPNSLLISLETGKQLSYDAIQSLSLTQVGETGYQFQPHGYTHVCLLSESHYSIHTYPEYHSCYIDIFCCDRHFDSNHAIQHIQRIYQTSHITYQVLSR